MKWKLAIGVLLLCVLPLWAGQKQKNDFKPIASSLADARVAKTRDLLTDLLWMYTETYWHKGDWDQCIRLCRQIIEIDPHFVEAYTSAAYLLWSRGQDAEAIELFQAGIVANPNVYDTYHEFGMYYINRKQWDKAIEQFRESVKHGAPMLFQHMLPNTLAKAGRKEEALTEWRAMLKRFPDDQMAKRKVKELERELRKTRKRA